MQGFNIFSKLKPVVFLFILSPHCFSQPAKTDSLTSRHDTLSPMLPGEIKFTLQVKQLFQFFERFNFNKPVSELDIYSFIKHSVPDGIDTGNYKSLRKKLLLTLFDWQNNKIDTTLTLDFINEVVDKSLNVYNGDDNWYAEVNCRFLFKDTGKPKNVSLIMQKEETVNHRYKWVFRSLKDHFTDTVKLPDSIFFISPVNNELFFSSLYQVFKEKKNIVQYAYNDYKPDDLGILFYLAKNGKINLENINSITYHFLELDNWGFTVNFFNRKGYNSGWLISGVFKLTDKQKEKYKYSILNIH